MTASTIIASLLVLSGAVLMSAAILQGGKADSVVPPGLRRRWRTMIALMALFLAGYLFFVFVLVERIRFPIELVAGLVFMGGAFFVFIVIDLSRVTIAKIQSSATGLEKAEQTLREKERFLRAIIDTEPECVKLIARDGSLITMNPAGLAMLQAGSLDKVKGKPIYSSVVPEHRAAFRKLTENVFSGISGELEFMVTGLKGRKLWLETHAVPLRNEKDEIMALLGITRDITRRKAAEDALRESERRLHSMASAALDAVILIDNDGNTTFWNQAAEKMFGYSSEEVLGRDLHSFIMPRRYAGDFEKGFGAFRPTGEGKFIGKIYEIEAKRKDGTEFPAELSLAALTLKDRWSAVGIVRDISRRKLMEKNLEESNRELEQFAYAASHDLRSPIISLAAGLKLFKRRNIGELDPESLKLIDGALGSAFRMQNLITGLLAYARLGVAGAEKASAPVDLTEVLDAVEDGLKVDCERAGCTIVRDTLPKMVNGDPTMMIRLFQNLISNSIKFSGKEPPRIEISAVRKDHEWLFSVKDNGIGIPQGHHERIFGLFQRVSAGAQYEGTGIGLAICKRIVERMGGRIWVESEPGKGSTFYFTVPAAPG